MPGAVLQSKKDMDKGGRGTTGSHVSKDGDETIVRQQDNNMVKEVSTFIGADTLARAKRWSKPENLKFVTTVLIADSN